MAKNRFVSPKQQKLKNSCQLFQRLSNILKPRKKNWILSTSNYLNWKSVNWEIKKNQYVKPNHQQGYALN